MTDDMEYFESAGVYDPTAPLATSMWDLLHFLIELGWDKESIVALAEDGLLETLADGRSLPSAPTLTLDEAAALAGMPSEELDRLRRVIGLSPRGAEGNLFEEDDIEGFRLLEVAASMFTEAESHHFARVLGSSLARIADAAVSLFLIDIEGPLMESGGTDLDLLKRNLEVLGTVDNVGASLGPLFQAHLGDAVRRNRISRQSPDPYTVRMAVGFVDLVGFTALTEELSPVEVGELIGRFEDTAYDLVADHGGRVVKMIGDEVMFVATDAEAACRVAASLIGEYESTSITPRGGIASGELVARGGDYYGRVVNLASRIAGLAVPGELLTTPEVEQQCTAFEFSPAGRRQLKGFAEPVELVALIS